MKMSITKILSEKETSAETKLTEVAEIVTKLRKSYGNEEVEIEDIKVTTTVGNLPFSSLEAESKVELLKGEAASIKATAIAATENKKGVVLNKVVEELIATSPLFVNVTAETGFDVL